MQDHEKSREQLLQEISELRQRLAEVETRLTDQEQLRDELAEARLLTKAALNASTDMVYVIDQSGTIRAINDIAAERRGRTPQELVGENIYDHMPQNLVHDRKRMIREAVETRRPMQYKEESKGVIFGQRLYPTYDSHTNAIRVALFLRDITENERALSALRESEARYRAILEDQTELICRYLPDGRLSYVNEAYARFFHKDRLELINQNFIPHIPDEDLHMINSCIASLNPDCPATTFEHRIIMDNGEVLWQSWTHRAIYDQYGNLSEYQAVGRSVTKRKLAQEALRESESRYRSLFEDSPISLWEEDFSLVQEYFDSLRNSGITNIREHFDSHPEAVRHCAGLIGILDVNRATLNLLEANHKAELLDGLDTFLPPDALHSLKEEFIALAEGSRVFRTETLHRTRSGGVRNVVVHLVVAPGYEDTLGKILVSLLDDTERKQAEKELHVHRAFLHQIIDTVPSPIFVKDRQGVFTLVNKALAQLYGTTVQDMIGRHGTDFNPHAEETTLFKSEDDEVFNTQKPIFISQRPITDSMGKRHWHSVTKLPLKGKDQILGVAVDITERKTAEAERSKLEKQFRQSQKLQALGTLAGGIAHDFNNMIFAILGFVRLALKRAPEEGKLHDYLEQIQSAGMRASKLVRQILTFSRHTEPEKKPVHVRILLEETAKMLRATLPTTISIATEVEPGLEGDEDTILGDPTQIHQVLMNLSTNAGHAMRDTGGVLTMSLGRAEVEDNGSSEAVENKPGRYLAIRIQDTGHGIAPEVIEQIFDPFFTTKKPGEGTGMGLSVVHGIVKAHGGTIRVISEAGQGAQFKVLLPLMEDKGCPDEAEAKVLPTGTERIMLIDDEIMIVQMVEEILSLLGYTVEGLTSPRSALERFEKEPGRYDMIITDQTMPSLTGLELTRKIRTLRPNVPIILITGYSEMVTQESAHRAGVTEYVMKPIVEEQLAQTVRRLLDAGHERRKNDQSAAC